MSEVGGGRQDVRVCDTGSKSVEVCRGGLWGKKESVSHAEGHLNQSLSHEFIRKSASIATGRSPPRHHLMAGVCLLNVEQSVRCGRREVLSRPTPNRASFKLLPTLPICLFSFSWLASHIYQDAFCYNSSTDPCEDWH